MNYLLDTHALLWALTDPAKLGPSALAVIQEQSSVLFVSAAFAWEISTKKRLGKLPQADVLVSAYTRHLDRLGVSRLSISEEHALLAGTLDWDHRDPFDRMLAAQAMIESLTLITNDQQLTNLPGVVTLW